MASPVEVGIVGCGAIGSEVAKAVSTMEAISAVHIFDIDEDATAALANLPNCKVQPSAEELVSASDLLVECANKGVVQEAVMAALALGKDSVLLTVGALANDELLDNLLAAAKTGNSRLHVPSGAIMGLDGVRAASEAGLKSVTLVTTKPPDGLDRRVDKWTLLFNGTARQAVKEYPKNINVAAALSLAGLGFDDTWVQVAVDPLATRNSHKVILEGDFGRARINVENLPSPSNPRTSHLAALSTIALIRRLTQPLQVGS